MRAEINEKVSGVGFQVSDGRGQMTDDRRHRSEDRIRPPASPSCRLYLRAGSHREHRAYPPACKPMVISLRAGSGPGGNAER